MKKIILFTLILSLLTACSNIKEDRNTTISQKKDNNISINNTEKKDNKIKKNNNITTTSNDMEGITTGQNIDKINIDDVENNLKKLKTIKLSEAELSELNNMIIYLYKDKIIKIAIKNKKPSLCKKLDSQDIKNCIKKVILSTNNPKNCDKLYNKNDIISCKNTILKKKAEKDKNENLCNKIIDNTKEKIEIKDCKNNIIKFKALSTLDITLCNKLTNDIEKKMCEDEVQMLKQQKIEEQKMIEEQKRIEKEFKKQQEILENK